MSTRGAIVRKAKTGFVGVYHHWDSYPEGLGKTLWDLYHGFFKEDLKKMLNYLIDTHPAGWSTINGKDFNLPAGYSDSETENPCCYCHGDRNEKPNKINHKNAADCGCEYVYMFDLKKKTMDILSSFNADGSKMIGMFGLGNPAADWEVIASVSLGGDEPNWKKITE